MPEENELTVSEDTLDEDAEDTSTKEEAEDVEKELSESEADEDIEDTMGPVDPETVDVNLEDIPEEKKEAWVESIIFENEVVDERELAGGRITMELSVNTGQDSLNISELVQEKLMDDEDASPQYVQTYMALAQAAHALNKVNGKVPGGSDIEDKIQWLEEKPAIFTDSILSEYEQFEAEVVTLLQEDGIKK